MFSYNPKKIKGFTLVELIIVITILAILATIAFVSFQNYVKDSRDSSRISALKNIESGLQTFQITTGNYPDPDNKVNITASGVTILYQGNISNTLSALLKINKKPLDPLDQIPYTYSTNIAKTKYELLTLRENPTAYYTTTTYAKDNTSRIPKTLGDKVGIVLDSTNNPIEQSGTGVDIVNTSLTYNIYLGDNIKISGSGTTTNALTSLYGNSSFIKNCKEILDKGANIGDGIYNINPNLTSTGTFGVYCEMSTDGGGWTLLTSFGNDVGGYFPTRASCDSQNISNPGIDKIYSQVTNLDYYKKSVTGGIGREFMIKSKLIGNSKIYYWISTQTSDFRSNYQSVANVSTGKTNSNGWGYFTGYHNDNSNLTVYNGGSTTFWTNRFWNIATTGQWLNGIPTADGVSQDGYNLGGTGNGESKHNTFWVR